jgi:hypothetical protein
MPKNTFSSSADPARIVFSSLQMPLSSNFALAQKLSSLVFSVTSAKGEDASRDSGKYTPELWRRARHRARFARFIKIFSSTRGSTFLLRASMLRRIA